jgi:CheY-like chemotaxis protein
LITDVLQQLGLEVVGPVGRLDAAQRLASQEALDGAILDVTIRGGLVFPVAETLLARGVPFVLATGHSDWALPEAFQDKPRLLKPFSKEQLMGQAKLLCGGAVGGSRPCG